MSDNNSGERLWNRREYIKKTLAGTALVSGPGIAAAQNIGKSDNPGHTLTNQATFVDPALGIGLPEAAEEARSPKAANVALLSSNSELSQNRQRGFVEKSTHTFFIGDDAESAVAATLYGIPKAEVSKERLKQEEKEISQSFGFEYGSDTAYQIGLTSDGSIISKNTFRRLELDTGSVAPRKHVSQEQVFGNVDTVVKKYSPQIAAAGFGVDSSVVYDTDESPDGSGYIGSDSWTAIGEDIDRTEVYDDGDHAGDIYKEVTGGYINDETNTDDDYWGWKTIHRITPASTTDTGWINNYMDRTFSINSNNLNNPEYIRQAPPESTNSTIYLGVEVSTSEIAWQWQSTSKEVTISQAITDNSTTANHRWEIAGSAISETVTGRPGYEVKVNEGETTQSYDFVSEWSFIHNGGAGNTYGYKHNIDSYAIWEK